MLKQKSSIPDPRYSFFAMNYQPIPGETASLAVAVIGVGCLIAMIATFILYPLIDRYLRDRFRLGRGQALSLLLASSLFVGSLGGLWAYFHFRDDPRFHPPGEDDTEVALRSLPDHPADDGPPLL